MNPTIIIIFATYIAYFWKKLLLFSNKNGTVKDEVYYITMPNTVISNFAAVCIIVWKR